VPFAVFLISEPMMQCLTVHIVFFLILLWTWASAAACRCFADRYWDTATRVGELDRCFADIQCGGGTTAGGPGAAACSHSSRDHCSGQGRSAASVEDAAEGARAPLELRPAVAALDPSVSKAEAVHCFSASYDLVRSQ
jgi:hypothetical protein